mmetsp:Transcript_79803/g.138278  ORF Transcript_79803/g.138278 Transcript_79803/m.138278 type:complete len:203 (+) Transcript_79803:147-755(+)
MSACVSGAGSASAASMLNMEPCNLVFSCHLLVTVLHAEPTTLSLFFLSLLGFILLTNLQNVEKLTLSPTSTPTFKNFVVTSSSCTFSPIKRNASMSSSASRKPLRSASKYLKTLFNCFSLWSQKRARQTACALESSYPASFMFFRTTPAFLISRGLMPFKSASQAVLMADHVDETLRAAPVAADPTTSLKMSKPPSALERNC